MQFKKYLDQLEETFVVYFVKKAPALPNGVKRFIVMIAPWLVILGALSSLPVLFGLVGFGRGVYPEISHWQTMQLALGPNYYITIILMLVSIVFELIALAGLWRRQKVGWDWMFYAFLVGEIGSLVRMDLVGFVVGTIISLYLLFQVREFYK